MQQAAKAARRAIRVALWVGIASFILSLADEDLRKSALFVILVTAAWFATSFAIVFTLAWFFPSPSDRLDFPGARKLIWPLVGLLSLVTTVAVIWRAGK